MKTKFLIVFFFLFSILNAGEKEVIKGEEMTAYSMAYKDIIHISHQIKKKNEEIQDLNEQIVKVRRDILKKEKIANSLLKDINDIPVVEILLLRQASSNLQTEQSLEVFKKESKKIEEKESNQILDHN